LPLRWKNRLLVALLAGLLLALPAMTPSSAAGAEGGGDKGKEGEIPLIRLPTMVFPVIKRSVVDRYMTLNIELHLTDIDARTRLAELQPRMVDALFGRLYGRISLATTEVEVRQLVDEISESMIGGHKIASVTVEIK